MKLGMDEASTDHESSIFKLESTNHETYLDLIPKHYGRSLILTLPFNASFIDPFPKFIRHTML